MRMPLLLGLLAVSGSLVAVAGQQQATTTPKSPSNTPQRVVPPLPTRESLEPSPGWKPDGHVVPHMPETLLRLPRTQLTRARYPAIDFHVHAGNLTTVAAYQTFIRKMDEAGIGAIVNLNGGTGAHLDQTLKAGEGFKDRVANFITFSTEGINEPGWSEKFAAEMERAFKAGAQGMKVAKGLGLSAKNPDGTFIQCDDPRLDAVWSMAAKYDKPVMIHVSDSIGRFYPIGPKNERFEAGLWEKPGDTAGNYYKNGYPAPEAIEKARETMHRKHPRTRFVNAHMAMLYYDPEKLATFLETHPNADVEVSAAIQDLGRAPRLWREFLIKYQDRVLMGSDGSPDRGVKDFWEPHWRFFETFDEYFEHPAQVRTPGGSPGHGRWNISGAGLPDEVIRKIYYANALRRLPALKTSINKQLTRRSE